MSTSTDDSNAKPEETVTELRTEVDNQEPDKPVENREQRCRERAKVLIEALTLGAVIFYGGVAYYQLAAMITSNEQTKAALHVSERAYVTVDSPKIDVDGKLITMSISNYGHIPSGNMEVVVHEATINLSIPNVAPEVKNAVEFQWKRHKLAPIQPGNDVFNVAVPIPSFSASMYNAQGAYQTILISGRVSYDDGFPDDGQQQWAFCFQSVYQLLLKKLFLVPCEAARVIPQMESLDGYPSNEHPN